ncbi:MAG: hypothetical protein KDD66_00510 [Bdellovibrionales bacterium]|nr:hypothetical protein [Bdellovibrionales bacterium]
MSILTRIGLGIAAVLALVAGAISCGSSTNNDQGVSFLALGFFEDGDGEAGDAGTVVFISETFAGTNGGPFPLFIPVDKDPEEPGLQGGFIGLQNNLTDQFVRTIRMDCSYDIPGSDPALRIPDDSWAFTTIVEAAADPENPSQAFTQVEIVSPDILSFLNVNQNLTPEPPFRMLATCWVVGVSSAGDTFTTNPVLYQVQFTDEPTCRQAGFCVGEPFNQGAGAGGTFTVFEDTTETAG